MSDPTMTEAFRDLRHRYPGWHVGIYIGSSDDTPHWMIRITRMLIVDGGVTSETYHSDQYDPFSGRTLTEAMQRLASARVAGVSAEELGGLR